MIRKFFIQFNSNKCLNLISIKNWSRENIHLQQLTESEFPSLSYFELEENFNQNLCTQIFTIHDNVNMVYFVNNLKIAIDIKVHKPSRECYTLKTIMVISHANLQSKESVLNKWWLVISCSGFTEKIEILAYTCAKKKYCKLQRASTFFFTFNRKTSKQPVSMINKVNISSLFLYRMNYLWKGIYN